MVINTRFFLWEKRTLSRPRRRMRSSRFGVDLNFFSSDSSPCSTVAMGNGQAEEQSSSVIELLPL